MRIGGPIFDECSTPEQWTAAVAAAGYSAAFCPLGPDAPGETVRDYAAAADEADIVIAEVGAWSNPVSPDPDTATAAMEHCKASLALAEAIGARCCVNIAGCCRDGRDGAIWHGPHGDDLSDEAFARVVQTVREIIDAVAPTRSAYALETMPWMLPDSPESYQRLIAAIDRDAFCVHLDPVNLINSPRRYFGNAGLVRECFARLGPHIRSCHAKDIRLENRLTVHLDECAPGRGRLDYPTYLRELDRLDPDTPLMLEHLATAAEYAEAAGHIRSVARAERIALGGSG